MSKHAPACLAFRFPDSDCSCGASSALTNRQDCGRLGHLFGVDAKCLFCGLPGPAGLDCRSLHRRLGLMADAMVSAKVGPQARFFTRERVDEIVLLLREAEKHILEGR